MSTPNQSQKLYVVLHGEMAIIDAAGSDSITLLIPNVPEHVCIAGPWLGESKILEGSNDLVLKGCETGSARLTDFADRFIIVDGAPGNANAIPYCTITLPRPEAILPGALFPIDAQQQVATVVSSSGSIEAQPRWLDLHPVFQYTVQDGVPYIDGGGSKWSSANTGAGGAFSLHIFSEEDRDPMAGHITDAFAASAALIGVDISLNPHAPLNQPEYPAVPGLHESETNMALAERVITMARLGIQLRAGESLVWNTTSIVSPLFGVPYRQVPFCLSSGSCPPIVSSGT